jgi:gentisate 1,2-dioxygenase
MAFEGPVPNDKLYLEQVQYGKEEQKRRKESPIFVSGEEVARQLEKSRGVYIVDPRMGFNNRTHRFFTSKHLPSEAEESQMWKTLGHRHTVEAVIYWLQGRGYSIIDGKRYDWGAGDFICVPMFAWHRHVNTGDVPALHIASTTGPLSMAIGQAVYEDERFPEYWIYAQEGEHALKTLLPGGESISVGSNTTGRLESQAGRLYAEQVAFAFNEEEKRRNSKVLVKSGDLRFESTAMGAIAYIVDNRIGFHVKQISTLVADIPPGKRSGAHRHFYDEIDYVLSGSGHCIINDQRYEMKKGDTLAIPVFAWHQYFNTGDQPLRLLAHSTRTLMESLGFSLTHQGEVADY